MKHTVYLAKSFCPPEGKAVVHGDIFLILQSTDVMSRMRTYSVARHTLEHSIATRTYIDRKSIADIPIP